jgi:two-component system chemotaxis response regulator CheY
MKAKLLIAEDSALDRERLLDALAGTELDVVAHASTGVEAVTRYRKFHPQLVLMDLVMPHMNGIEAARAILQYDPNAKIIPVTALSQSSVKREAEGVGMIGFVSKPVERAALLAQIERALQ